jgi:hypothetical protein
MLLNPKKDYGFSEPYISNTKQLSAWDDFKLQKVQEIFESCETILDFGNSSRELSNLFI